MNLRNTPIDRRYKETRDVPTSQRELQAKRTKARAGALSYMRNAPQQTTTRSGGTGGYGASNAQALRLSQIAQDEARAKSFRPEDPV